MLPAEILRKVKLLEISTRRKVNNMFVGEYHSAFKGQGMAFSEFREYVPGDDVRSIAWSLTAKTGKTYIKKYDEERETTVMLAVDVSGSQEFGSKEYLKGEVVAHLAALLGFVATSNKDPVGLLLFSDQVEHYVPPKKGRGHILRMLRDLYFYKPKSKGTKLSVAADYLLGVLKKKAHIFIMSDFMDGDFESSLRRLGKKHDTVAVIVGDQLEIEVPKMGLVHFEDPETGYTVCVDTTSLEFQKSYAQHMASAKQARETQLRRAQVDLIEVNATEDIVNPLIAFFRRRNRK